MMRVLPCGERALLVELPDAATRRSWDAHLQRHPLPGVLEVVPAAVTVGLVLDGTVPAEQVAQAVLALQIDTSATLDDTDAPAISIEVIYDGDDLTSLADLLNWTPPQLVAWHTGQTWTCDFCGFLPGFGYLIGDGESLTVPRLSTPRPRIKPGSVGLAGSFTGIYPQASPGGWQLIGRTTASIWDEGRTPPTLLAPGARVRFVAVAP